ncbi:translation elongation factor Ts [Ahrensia sp. R2A130]|uniref:translation elongation factor Ts n=1 Tax=Ahrensia sp. R2A130 TaxID=744979 RepID=UPI0001E0C990|nr:translation elongation factor Ts [Ahrensia sp. R2A130]EFL90233.1 translation elongation factor Ts [Ahrensia sp. R2A130]
MAITASMVKELREMTGAGMMDCKNALNETNGDIEAAVDYLRKKGVAKADKKSGRTAAEGLVGVEGRGNKAAVIEFNAETDFVSRNEDFQKLVSGIAKVAADTDGSVDAINASDLGGKTVADSVTSAIATIGENMSLRRAAVMEVENGVVASYVHNATADGLGKIGVLVALESAGDTDKLHALGRQVAMHVAATNPLAATKDDMDPDLVEREKKIFSESARESGKPENIIEKMVEGRIRKFFEENVLLSQTFVIDGENSVEQALKNAEGDVGGPIALKGFTRFQLGEGIEKEEGDFAAEVAAMSKG